MITVSDEVMERISRGFTIPSKPQILIDIQRIIDDPDADLMQLATLLSRDIGLSSLILKTINSPQYGMSRTISDIPQAVMLLGSKSVGTLVSGLLLRNSFSTTGAISLERLWDNASMVADTMVYVGKTIKDKIAAENLYATGLFHDCGIAAMSQRYPDYRQTLEAANKDYSRNPLLFEDELYQCNHAQVGFFIASGWSLPKDICQVVLHHHEEEFLRDHLQDEIALVFATLKIADNIVNRIRRGRDLTDWAPVSEQCFDALGITEMDYLDLLEDSEQMMA